MVKPCRSTSALTALIFALAVVAMAFLQPAPAFALSKGQGVAGLLGGLAGAVVTAILATQFAPLGLVAGALLGSSLGVWIGGLVGGGSGLLKGPFAAMGGMAAGAAMGLVLGPIAGALLGWNFAWFGGLAGVFLGYKFGNRIVGFFQKSDGPWAPESSLAVDPRGAAGDVVAPQTPMPCPTEAPSTELASCKIRLDEAREALTRACDEGSEEARRRALDALQQAESAFEAALGTARPLPVTP